MSPVVAGRGAHPRWRGEHTARRGHLVFREGSSPLARGAPTRSRHRRRRPGLIPAGAGSTRGCPAGVRVERAHPRWRGEHREEGARPRHPEGSSPLARGALISALASIIGGGLIPAGAGSTRSIHSRRRTNPAHPRWRGEHRMIPAPPVIVQGSSPLARGARDDGGPRHGRDGLIPAGAGSTTIRASASTAHAAHPRWRGERFFHGLTPLG